VEVAPHAGTIHRLRVRSTPCLRMPSCFSWANMATSSVFFFLSPNSN
jgi:hypothetical protein